MKPIDSAGMFRGEVVGWACKTLPSGDPVVSVRIEIDAVLAGGDWERLGERRSCQGDFFVVKKTGAPNEKVVEMLCTVLGWGGSFAELAYPPPRTQVAVEIVDRDYKGKTYYQANWLRHPDSAMPARQPDALELDAKHADLRQLAGKFRKAAQEAPPKPAPASVGEDDIPF